MLFANACLFNLEEAVEVTLMLLKKGGLLDDRNHQSQRPFDVMMAKPEAGEGISYLINYIKSYSSSHPEIAKQYESEVKQMLDELEEASLSSVFSKKIKLTPHHDSPPTSPSTPSPKQEEGASKPRFTF